MEHWFVYYRVEPRIVPEVRGEVRRVQQEVCSASRVNARLMQRSDEDGSRTLLEIYEDIADPPVFEALLANALAHSRLPASLVAQRRTEKFKDA